MKKHSKHGKRAATQAVVSVPMEKTLKAALEKLAEKDGRKLAPFMRLHLEEIVRKRKPAPTSLVTLEDEGGAAGEAGLASERAS